MLSFKEFLKESKWSKYLYHATYDDFDPKKIKKGSHFGTLHAAMARAHHGEKYLRKRGQLKIHAYEYNRQKGTTRGARDNWEDKKEKEPKKKKGVNEYVYRNKYEDPGSKSSIIHDTENLKHVKTFTNPKFLKRKHVEKYIGWGDNNKDREYLENKGRNPIRSNKDDPKTWRERDKKAKQETKYKYKK